MTALDGSFECADATISGEGLDGVQISFVGNRMQRWMLSCFVGVVLLMA
jgi:hypothetical protein